MADCPGPALPEIAVKAMITTQWGELADEVVSHNSIRNGVARIDDILVEIVRHESHFNPTCVGDEGEIGLFQIHPVNFAQFGTNRMALFDPVTNVRVAYELWKKSGDIGDNAYNFAEAFSPWTTYDEALRSVNTNPATIPGNTHEGGLYPGQLQLEDAVGNVVNTVTDWASGLMRFFQIILDPAFWKRIGIGALGVAVVIGAIIFYNRDKAMMVVTKGMAGGKKSGPAQAAGEAAA
jgi:hypothetical protein